METLNFALFASLNASAHPNPYALAAAIFFGQLFIALIPVYVATVWFRGAPSTRACLIEATASATIALALAALVGAFWPHPRPFVIGIGHTLIGHAADASFPSDHLTLLSSLAASFMLHRRFRRFGRMLALSGIPVAWARIYLGVHFPADMLGAAIVGAVGAAIAHRASPLYLEPACRVASTMHRRIFRRLIDRGWVRA